MVAAQNANNINPPDVSKLALDEPQAAAAHVPPAPLAKAPAQPHRPPAVSPGADLESASEDGYDDDDDDPFGDKNVVATPAVERHEPGW